MTNEVKFLQGAKNVLTAKTDLQVNTIYAANDSSVLAIANQLYYGKPYLEYVNNKLALYGVSGDSNTKLGEVDFTLDSFLEGAQYIAGSASTEGYSAETEAYKWASGVSSSITQAQVTSAYTTAFGTDYSGDKSAIVMVMHTESGSSGDSHSVIVLPLGKIIGNVQAEIDRIEVGAGLNADGTYSADTTAHITSGATSLKNADHLLSEAIYNLSSASTKASITAATFNSVSGAITSEDNGSTLALSADTSDINVADDFTTTEYPTELQGASAIATGDTISSAFTKVETTISALTQAVIDNEKVSTAAIKALGNAAGTISADGTIAYTANTSDTYISGATSLANADDLLDAAIKELAGKVYSATTNLGVESTGRTIDVTYHESGKTTIDVNYDGKTIQKTSGGTLYVHVSDSADSAVHIATGDSGVTVSLTLDTPNSAMTLSQSASGLKAEVKLDNSAVSDTTGGIELTQSTNGIAAKLYWGSFDNA